MPEQMQECRSCGAPDARVVEVTKRYMAPFGKPVSYQQAYTDCAVCGEKVDVSNPEAFPEAIREAEINSVDEILNYLKEHGITQGQIERCLELPYRQVSNWKSKEAWSKSALALLRIVRAYPWILEVADNHFDPMVVHAKMLEAAHEERKALRPLRVYSSSTRMVSRIFAQGEDHDLMVERAVESQAWNSRPLWGDWTILRQMVASGALVASATAAALEAPWEADILAGQRATQLVYAPEGLAA